MSNETLGFDDLMALACGKDSASGKETVAAEGAMLNPGQAEEMKQLAILFAELEREFGESDDPDLRFAAAFARQCAMGELGTID